MLTKEFKVDNLTVKKYDSRNAMGEASGKEAAAHFRKLLAEKKEIWVIFAAAPSQNEFLATLAAEPGIDWGRVHAIHMDEYVGLPKDHPAGFGNFLDRTIWSKVPIASINYIGSERDPEEAIAEYNKILSEHHIDVCLMGIGENGHIAFNDPHVADFNDPLKIKKVDLDLTCRTQQVHDGCFATLDEVPKYALTLTIPTLFACDRLFCMVPATTKANAVKATIYGPISESCPASIMRRHKDATLYIDQDSGKYVE
jgi:glucosamine-6-phosphate deaminase